MNIVVRSFVKFLYHQYIYIYIIYMYTFPHYNTELPAWLTVVFQSARLCGFRRLTWMYGYLGILGTWSSYSWLEQWKRLHGQVRHMVLGGDSLSLVWAKTAGPPFFKGVGMISMTSVLDLLQLCFKNVFVFMNALAFGNYHELVDRLRLGGCTPCALSQKRNKFRSTFPSPKKQQKATLPSHPLKLRSFPASQRRWFLSSC